MSAARPSLAWKIATANILPAIFAVLLAGMLQYRNERRILATTMPQILAQVRLSNPREALGWVNQQLLIRSTHGLFVAMTYLVREAQSGELCYATGGHLPMLRRGRATDAV